MNLPLILHFSAVVLLFIAFFMLFPTGVSLFYQSSDMLPLLKSSLITAIIGAVLFFSTVKQKRKEIRTREAFVIVTFTWVLMTLSGSLPFLFAGTFESFTDACFESMAGFTTTGASALSDIEAVPRGILFWRSMTQWIGGMGIIVFALAILPLLGTGGMQLFRAEVPGINVDKLRPRIIDTAKALWMIYVVFTITDAALLLTAGMSLYDAVCHSFTTMATGGFSTKNASIAYFRSPAVE